MGLLPMKHGRDARAPFFLLEGGGMGILPMKHGRDARATFFVLEFLGK